MPRKTKEQIEKESITNIQKDTKNDTVKTLSTTENDPKKTAKKSAVTKPASKTSTTKTNTKKSKTTTAKVSKEASSTKNTIAKTDKKTKKSNKTSNRKSTKANNLSTPPTINEYYDLPYRYNQTIVKVLAQTPNNLFIYWDISDEDRENLKKQYGENFFEITRPILIVYNETLGYSFEVEINDFANSWYLHVNDSKSNYKIELGRKPINQEEFKNSIHKNNIQNHLASDENTTFIHITTSNNIEAPNDRILFNKSQKMVYYRNVKTDQEFAKNISSLSFMHNIGKIYDIYDLYKEIYNKENIEELYNLDNPSSHSSSTFK